MNWLEDHKMLVIVVFMVGLVVLDRWCSKKIDSKECKGNCGHDHTKPVDKQK